MDAYRKKPIPVIYTQLGFVRASSPCILADCADDLPLLQKLQRVAVGDHCVSELEVPHVLIVKAEFPDDILTRDGSTGDVVTWRKYYWKLWDAESYVTGCQPAEAVDSTNAGIDTNFLDSLAHPTSCLPMLRKTEHAFSSGTQKGYQLRSETAAAIDQGEKTLIARIELAAMKQLKPVTNAKPPKMANDPQVSPTLRDAILRRDKYRCIFCGRDSSATVLEVNHIIPRSLINKLHLDSALHIASENLCVTCFDCNRGKSDHLATEDIAYYRNAFSNPEHPNHTIRLYLLKISELQALGRENI